MNLRKLFFALSLAPLLFFSLPGQAPAAPLSVLGPDAIGATSRGPRIYKLPYPAGMTLTMCQANGEGTHTGNGQYAWDFCMPIGTPVVASRGGVVRAIEQEFDQSGWGPAFADKNNYVVIDHGDGTSALYMHLMHNGARVQVGQAVKAGQLIAYSGNTGWTHGPHTHFMVMRGGGADWYAPSLPVAFADVPGDGVPRDGQRLTSGNEPVGDLAALKVCESTNSGSLPGFTPRWVQSFKPSTLWSGVDAQAVPFGPVSPWQFFLVLAPQQGNRLQVRSALDGGTAFLPAGDAGPSGPPAACQ